jgi:hypothetical protein
MALAYAWYGDTAAKTIAKSMASWANTTTGGKSNGIYLDGYYQNGTPYDVNNANANSAMSGGLTVAGMVDSSLDAWTLSGYKGVLAGYIGDQDLNYYDYSLGTLYVLLMSGNMPNFWGGAITHPDTLTTLTRPLTATVDTVSAVGVSPIITTHLTAKFSKAVTKWRLTFTGASSGKYYVTSTAASDTIDVTWSADMNKLSAFGAGQKVYVSIDSVWSTANIPANSKDTLFINATSATGIQSTRASMHGVSWGAQGVTFPEGALALGNEYQVRCLDLKGRVIYEGHARATASGNGVALSLVRPTLGNGVFLMDVQGNDGIHLNSMISPEFTH